MILYYLATQIKNGHQILTRLLTASQAGVSSNPETSTTAASSSSDY